MKIKSLALLLVLSSSFNANSIEYSEQELPSELHFSQEMIDFHKRDFFKEITEASKEIKSCVSQTCTLQEEEQVLNQMWAPFITKVNEMSWKCDHAVIVKIINAKDDVETIRPLVKRMRYCNTLNDKFQDYVYKECLQKLKHRQFMCQKFNGAIKENQRRKMNLNRLTSY